MHKYGFWVAAALLLVPTLAAGQAPPKRDEIVVAFATESTTLDPAKAAAGADQFFHSQMFEQLLRRSSEGKQVNWLAQSYSVDTNNGKPIISVTLRRDVKFHNGDPVTAADFEFAYNRLRDPKVSRIANRQSAVEKFEVVDDLHFRLHFREGDASYITENLRLFALPKKYFNSVGEDVFQTNPVGTGPWKFVSRKVGEEIRFERFEDYWNKEHWPSVKKLTIKVIPEGMTRVAALKTGAVDLIESVPVTAVKELQATPGIQSATVNTGNNLYVELPTQLPNSPFRDPRVRLAVAHAFDMNAIIKNVLLGQGEPSTQLSSDDIGFEPNMKPYAYDPARSKKLLAEAGFPRGLDTPCYNIVTAREPNLKEVGEAIFAYLSAVGIRCRIVGLDYAAWLNHIRSDTAVDGPTSAMYGHFGGDPSSAWFGHLHSRDKANGLGQASMTKNPEIDRLMKEQAAEMDLVKRIAVIRKIADMKNEQALGGIPTYRPRFTFAWRENVKFVPWPEPGLWRSMQEIGFK